MQPAQRPHRRRAPHLAVLSPGLTRPGGAPQPCTPREKGICKIARPDTAIKIPALRHRQAFLLLHAGGITFHRSCSTTTAAATTTTAAAAGATCPSRDASIQQAQPVAGPRLIILPDAGRHDGPDHGPVSHRALALPPLQQPDVGPREQRRRFHVGPVLVQVDFVPRREVALARERVQKVGLRGRAEVIRRGGWLGAKHDLGILATSYVSG